MNFIEKYKYLIIFAFLIIVVYFVGNNLTSSSSNAPIDSKFIISSVKRGDIKESVLVTGKVETANYFPVRTSVNGIVKKILVKEGNIVYKGQKIMEIALNSDGEADYQSALSNYLSAKINLEKVINEKKGKQSTYLQTKYDYERLRDKPKDSNEYQVAITKAQNDFESAKNLYELQDEAIKQAKISLNKTTLSLQAQSPNIIAPENGTVSNITYVEGMSISNSLSERSSVSIAAIKNEGESIISFLVSELDIYKIKIGQKVNLGISSISEEKFEGEVVGVDRVGNISNNLAQYTVIIKLNKISGQIFPNMKAEGEILINEKTNVLMVPTAAVISRNNQKLVTLENGNDVEISTGISNSSDTEILSGLNEGDKVKIEALPTTGFINSNSNNMRTPSFFGR